VNFTISQIGDFKFKNYNPDINEIDTKKPDVLTPEQLKTFLNMDADKITPVYRDRKRVELYYDFCVFMFHSFFSPCDVIKLKYKDIDRQGMIHVKRKKTHKPVEIPVNPVMAKIIDKYRGRTKNGYIFPIMDDEKEKEYKLRDYLFKYFGIRVNVWLKHVEKELGTDYALYAYVFRHTAITFALDNNIPFSYVAMAAGTSIEMIQKHYYNGNNPQNTERLQQVFMCAAN
jgi:integrase